MKRILCALLITLICSCLFAGAAALAENITSGYYTYCILEDGTAEITAYDGREKTITVPAVLDGIPVTGIAREAFYGNKSVEHLIVSEGVRTLEDFAFFWCPNMQTAVLPESLERVGFGVFRTCEKLTSVTIPAGVREITGNPFVDTPKLNLTLAPGNPSFVLQNGILFQPEKNTLIYYPMTLKDEEYRIPEGIEVIGSGAFAYCDSLKLVYIPASVKDMGENPFCCINKKGRIGLELSPDNQDFELIDDVLFHKADRRLVYYIKNQNKAYAIPEGTRIVGSYAFLGCKQLVELTFPESLVEIGEFAFSSCQKLKQITLPAGLEILGGHAFQYMPALQQITIPDGVRVIGTSAFLGCKKLASVQMGQQVQRIGDRAFLDCNALTDITLPASLKVIGREAFANCGKLKQAVLPEGLEQLGAYAFSGCAALNAVNLPLSLTEMGTNPFRGAKALTSITVAEDHPVFAMEGSLLISRVEASAIWYPMGSKEKTLILPEGLLAIGNEAFLDCKGLKTVTLPASLTHIGENAFSDGKKWKPLSTAFSVQPGTYAAEWCVANGRKTAAQ